MTRERYNEKVKSGNEKRAHLETRKEEMKKTDRMKKKDESERYGEQEREGKRKENEVMEQKIRKKDEREIRYVSMQRHKRISGGGTWRWKYECCLAEFEVLLSVKTWTFYYNPRLVVQIPFPV